MEPITQAILVAGLVALLLLLLGRRSAARRRARLATADTETTSTPVDVEQTETEPLPQVEVQVEVEVPDVAEVEPDVVVVAEVEPDVVVVAEVEPDVVVEAVVEADAGVDTGVDAGVEAEAAPPVPSGRRGARRRRSRRGDAAAPPVLAEPVVAGPIVESGDQAELRALREQLRALEQVVQQQAADHPTAALARVEETAAQQSEAYLRQVSFVVRGLAAHTSEDENPRRTLARVAAAVERLGVPNQMERPILPVTKELSSRPQPDGPANPSHRREVAEVEMSGRQAQPAPGQDPTVFRGLSVPAAVESVDVLDRPAQPVLAPSYPESVTAPDRLDEPDGFGPEPAVAAVHPYETDSGISTYQLAEAVLPVPPPAPPEISGRRLGRSRKSR